MTTDEFSFNRHYAALIEDAVEDAIEHHGTDNRGILLRSAEGNFLGEISMEETEGIGMDAIRAWIANEVDGHLHGYVETEALIKRDLSRGKSLVIHDTFFCADGQLAEWGDDYVIVEWSGGPNEGVEHYGTYEVSPELGDRYRVYKGEIEQ